MKLRSIVIFIVLGFLSTVIYYVNYKLLVVSLVWSGIIALLHYFMERTSRISLFRTIFFAILAFSFLMEMHIFFNQENSFLPYCHIGMAGNVLNIGYNEFLAIKNQTFLRYGALSIGIAWLLIILINGGGFCSYGCFFGGIDDTFSQLLRKPLIRISSSTKFREFQFALLIFLIAISFIYSYSVFCQWLCPLKLSCSIINENSRTYMFQVYLFIGIGLVFLVMLPFLAKKRFFCSVICPFGALPPLVHKFTPYKITIDKSSCSKCGKCSEVCPSFAIVKSPKTSIPHITRFCTLCMRCASKCPTKSIKQTLYNRKETSLIPFISIMLGGAVSLFYLPNAIIDLINFLCSLKI
ncbi:MAG TPA: hypothetical protein DD381_11480 [Lentisphaeria bacterium]|nr:MAG: hypothetical protein A2X47_10020 [Lentisphaerae bacterium GWF2_38_69]HBM16951.1 hypothetical protein [Lentisphaeria bacterium]